ncbi:hypothetical protein KKG83_00045 [Candidatus Micrarchaeota archaeon]|nr:hypothetical protein [Candidatus Micrarchaeota archaeon]MBU2475842.1 hypothetical protein [Candidatus Micrarchaeota archaeon]
MAEKIAKTKEEMIAKLKSAGIKMPEKYDKIKPAKKESEVQRKESKKTQEKEIRTKDKKPFKPIIQKKKKTEKKQPKEFSSVMGEITVLILALYFGVSLTGDYFYRMDLGILSDDSYLLLLIGVIAFAIAVYAVYRIYSKLTGSEFKFDKMFSFAEKTPESSKVKEFFTGIGRIILIFVIGIGLIWLIFSWNDLFELKGEKVEVSGISFIAPEGWQVKKYPAPLFDVQVLGPVDGESNPNFLIGRHMILKTFEQEVQEAKQSIIDQRITILDEERIEINGMKAVVFTYRNYNEEEKVYKKGKTIFIDIGFGDSLTIMFFSKEESYEHNLFLFNQSLSTLVIGPPE